MQVTAKSREHISSIILIWATIDESFFSPVVAAIELTFIFILHKYLHLNQVGDVLQLLTMERSINLTLTRAVLFVTILSMIAYPC